MIEAPVRGDAALDPHGRQFLLSQPDQEEDEGACGYRLRLADMNGLTYRQVVQFETEGRFGRRLEPPRHAAESVRMHLGVIARFCPTCLGKRGVWLDAWEVPLVDACPTCGHWLVDLCGSCGENVLWSRKRLLYCSCGHSLTSELSRPAPVAVHALSQALHALAHRQKVDTLPMLTGLEVEDSVQLCVLLARFANEGSYRKLRSVNEVAKLADSWHISSAAAEVLAAWPQGLFTMLEMWRHRRGDHDRGSLNRAFAGFYRAIYKDRRAKALGFVREAFNSYIAQFWPGALAKRNRRLYGALPQRMPWVVPTEAARILEVPRSKINNLIEAGELKFERRVTAKGRLFTAIERASVEQLATTIVHGLTLDEASKRLGLEPRRLADLLPYLCPEAKPSALPGRKWSIPEPWVRQWELLVKQAPRVKHRQYAACSSLEFGLRYLLRDTQHLAEFLTEVKTGRFLPVGVVTGTRGLASLAFDRLHFRSWARRPVAGMEPWLTMPEAAVELKVKQEVAYALGRANLLATECMKVGRRLERRTRRSSLAAFLSENIFARDIAKDLRCSPKHVSKLLTTLGLTPVAGPGVNGCRQLVYRREDVNACLHGCTQAGGDGSSFSLLRLSAGDKPPTDAHTRS